MAKIIDGKTIARAIAKKLENRIKNAALTPGLAAILIGEDEFIAEIPDSGIFYNIRNIVKEKGGINRTGVYDKYGAGD